MADHRRFKDAIYEQFARIDSYFDTFERRWDPMLTLDREACGRSAAADAVVAGSGPARTT